ncbi:serine/threonine-protein kinase [Micromonospora fulviviridis]|uniref:serine/threonine-protein kinase n=1 Tax=Micromonospora fulviviridis TaxID=47860 RepID=UPI0037B12452
MAGLTGGRMPGTTPLSSHDPRTAGPYQLIGRLGAGGQGVVYLGRDGNGNRVAVKMINVDLRQSPRIKSQFAKEIEAARRVAPFCTAQILFAEVDADPPYVVSEFIEGPTLQRHVREQGPISGNALHRLAVGTATALTAIHQSDVVHRDLKPDNVILGQDGPRVIDFGIARALDVTETMTRQVMGTAPYMAPERFHNRGVGPACDVFAWAATIAFAAAGRPPFGNDSIVAVMNRVLHEPPDLHGLSDALDDLIRQCLQKEQDARPNAEQVLLRLLGHTARPSTDLLLETVLKQGNEAATAPAPSYPAPGSPPLGHAARPTLPDLTEHAPVTRVTGAPAPRENREPTAPVRRGPWSGRLRRELGDPWGVSIAIFLGAVGIASGYVASAAVDAAALTGVVTFVVVYVVRLLVAAALAPSTGPDPGEASTPDQTTTVLRSRP